MDPPQNPNSTNEHGIHMTDANDVIDVNDSGHVVSVQHSPKSARAVTKRERKSSVDDDDGDGEADDKDDANEQEESNKKTELPKAKLITDNNTSSADGDVRSDDEEYSDDDDAQQPSGIVSDASSDEFELLPTDSTGDVKNVSSSSLPPHDNITGAIPYVQQPDGIDVNNNHSDPSSEVHQKPNLKSAQARERKRQSRKRARQAAARRARGNTSVYVNGLPSDVTEEELNAHFSKCGILLPDARTGRGRVKIYVDEQGKVKGDALITYALRPSVENALAILHDAPLRLPPNEYRLCVEEAQFDPNKERAKRIKFENEQQGQQKQHDRKLHINARDLIADSLAWDDGDVSQMKKGLPRIVILKNVFDHSPDTNYDVIEQEMYEGGSGCGDLDKVTVFRKSAHGAIALKFQSTQHALKCIQVMNGRWYDGRQLSAELYDGKTDYRYKETDMDREQREREWEVWLQGTDEGGSNEARFENDEQIQQKEHERKLVKDMGGLNSESLAKEHGDEAQTKKGLPIVILKNAFEHSPDTNYDVIEQEMYEGGSECGDLDKVTIFRKSAHGAVALKFHSMQNALKCIQVMNGRWYDGRQLAAELHDEKVEHRHKETKTDHKQRGL